MARFGAVSSVDGQRAAVERGGRLSVVNASGMVAHVLDITGVGGLLRPGSAGRHGLRPRMGGGRDG
ncbi:hypothetical protein [Dactylosporangium sp. CA-233914]|uniref:hypothetical protein n=1 Tax=Dactylosporangium sp. CA-233914 TaxID=3239934 RepID=UPI003D8B7403